MNTERELEREADRVFRNILEGMPELRVKARHHHPAAAAGCGVLIEAVSGKARYRFLVQVRSRITPQTALALCQQLRQRPEGTIAVVYAPVISPRVAQMVREQGIGYADRAGNCWLRSLHNHLLIERQGFQAERQPAPAAADPFSTKSSRIVRALLSWPGEGWQVRKLAAHPDVQVSVGLVVKVKRALVEEGYAVEQQRRLYLRDPVGLLNAWSQKYPGPAEAVPLYFRGEPAVIEQTISRWCRDHALRHALAGFSAAWRLAPEVRYTVAAVYLEDRGFDSLLLDQLTAQCGGKQVESGANLYLWRPYDQSVFAGSEDADRAHEPVTSALQTYLDLGRAAGRGEDAAKAIFDKCLSRGFRAAAKHEEEWQRDLV